MPSTWDTLRVWINEQETAEIQTGRPAPLTTAQRHAIAVLAPDAAPLRAPGSSARGPAPAPAPKTGPEVDPDFDSATDWISLLNLHGQQNEFEHPIWEGKTLSLASKPGVKFEMFCTVPDIEASFPNEDYGFVRDEAPCFSNKKDAKKYAAMCAMRCINDLVSRPKKSTANPPTPHLSTPRHLPPRVQDPENTNGVPLKRTNGGPSSPSDSDADRITPPSARKKEKLDDDPDALRQIPDLCKALGMTPPRFETTHHDEGSALFDACPVFRADFVEKVPPGLGEVAGMLGKKTAKEASAVQVLEWLKGLERERKQEFAGISGS